MAKAKKAVKSETVKTHLFTSESVTMGHPDKVADQISDAVLDAALKGDPKSRVACETMIKNELVIVAGEITTKSNIDIVPLVKETIKNIGYNKSEYGFDYNNCTVLVALDKQSPDISQGVTQGQGLHKEMGAGDQGLMFGYACNETPELMPLPIRLAHKITEKLAQLRKNGKIKWLRPDGKSQVTVEYVDNKPKRIHTVVVSTQHDEDVSYNTIRKEIIQKVILPVLPKKMVDKNIIYHINPTGRFVIGGPKGDCGLTGRKIIVDTYGGSGSHGGGAFSGKDPSKVDRSASYMARYIAKNIVAAGLADRCEIQLSYAIGVAEPISVLVDCEGTEKVAEKLIEKLVRKHFPLTPKGIINHLKLLRPIYRHTAYDGHFGHEKPEFTWENTDKAKILRKEAGLA